MKVVRSECGYYYPMARLNHFDPKVTVPYRAIGAGLSIADGDARRCENEKLQGKEREHKLTSLATQDTDFTESQHTADRPQRLDKEWSLLNRNC